MGEGGEWGWGGSARWLGAVPQGKRPKASRGATPYKVVLLAHSVTASYSNSRATMPLALLVLCQWADYCFPAPLPLSPSCSLHALHAGGSSISCQYCTACILAFALLVCSLSPCYSFFPLEKYTAPCAAHRLWALATGFIPPVLSLRLLPLIRRHWQHLSM